VKKILFLTCLLISSLLVPGVSAGTTYVLDESYGNVPVTFVPNVGQFDSTIVFVAEGNDGNALRGNSGVAFQLEDDDTIYPLHPDDAKFDGKLYLQFINANTNPTVTYEEPVTWNSNYFIGNDPENWHMDVPNYRTARLHEIYSGIDMLIRGNGRDIEYLLAVKPNADPSQILFRDYDEDITGVSDGKIVGEKSWMGSIQHIVEPAPTAFQYIDNTEVPVSLSYKFIYVGSNTVDNVAFGIGNYNSEYELFIKLDMFDSPLIALKHTTDVAGVEVDDEGCAYVAGSAEYRRTNFKLKTLFAMKINSEGDELRYVTYFGGKPGPGIIADFAVDSKGNIFITGAINFPATPGAFDIIIGEFKESKCVVMKLSETGNKIVYSTYLGGNDIGEIRCIDVDSIGNAYVTGWTLSKYFPTTLDVINPEYIFVPYLDTYMRNGFITKFNIDGSELDFSTFFDTAELTSIKVDNSGVIRIAGNDAEVFVAALNATASDSLFTLRFGGNDKDEVTGMDIDNEGNIYVAGYTESKDFYTTDGSVYQGGNSDCFIAKVGNIGTLVWSKLLGGSILDEPTGGLEVDNDGNIFISGFTTSPEFPRTPDAYLNDIMHGNGFFTVINSDGINIEYSTLLSGPVSYGKAIDAKSEVYLASSSSFPELSGKGVFDSRSASISLIRFKAYEATYVLNESSQPKLFTVQTPYPNPFNPSVTLSYRLFRDSDVTLDIYNIHGQKISTVINTFQIEGLHLVKWDGSDFPSGVYFYRIYVGDEIKTGKLLLLK